MKVVSGKYKGRSILGFDLDGTRPTMDRVKESMFAMIQGNIRNSVCLDLFSGSGNLGIEALSQGAQDVFFTDKNKKACVVIKKNLDNLGINFNNILNLDYRRSLEYYKEKNISFDVLFLDPPYDTDFIKNSIEKITEYNLVNDNGIIVCESNCLDKIVYDSSIYMSIKERKYGDKWVVIIKKI